MKTINEKALSDGGSRVQTRGWRGSSWIKRRTNKAMRKMARQDPENAPTRKPLSGWVW